MKSYFLILAIIGLAYFGCTKVETKVSPIKPVGTVEGSYKAVYGDISIAKSVVLDDPLAPTAVTNVWTMLRKDGSKVNGTEFIDGSAAQIWWSTKGNNPVSFSASQGVYSNLTPDEDLRLQLIVLDSQNSPIYFGLVDFNPDVVSFPLSVNGYRLGDYLSLNAYAVSKLPGANLTISVDFTLAPLDSIATVDKTYNKSSVFGFNDIKYDETQLISKNKTYNVTTLTPDLPVVIYASNLSNEKPAKIYGDVKITITEAATSSTPSSSYVVTVLADKFGKPGKGTSLTLKTTKVGWYDSSTVGGTNADISVNADDVTVN